MGERRREGRGEEGLGETRTGARGDGADRGHGEKVDERNSQGQEDETRVHLFVCFATHLGDASGK